MDEESARAVADSWNAGADLGREFHRAIWRAAVRQGRTPNSEECAWEHVSGRDREFDRLAAIELVTSFLQAYFYPVGEGTHER